MRGWVAAPPAHRLPTGAARYGARLGYAGRPPARGFAAGRAAAGFGSGAAFRLVGRGLVWLQGCLERVGRLCELGRAAP